MSMTLSSTTQSLPWTNARILRKRNSRDSMYQVAKLHCSKTSMAHPPHMALLYSLICIPRTPKKPKSKKPGPSAKADAAAVAVAGPSHLATIKKEGTKESPIALGSDDDDVKPGQKRKRYTTVVENGKKRRVVNIVSPFGVSSR